MKNYRAYRAASLHHYLWRKAYNMKGGWYVFHRDFKSRHQFRGK